VGRLADCACVIEGRQPLLNSAFARRERQLVAPSGHVAYRSKSMRARPLNDPSMKKLLQEASARPMSEATREEQLVSLAYGNLKIENDRITRPLIEDALRISRPKR
jgi:hypothetical protein